MMTLEAHAKVNLTLEVGDLRPDGYHDLRSVVAPISLFDVVELEPADEIVDAGGIDFGAENLAVRAARALRRAAGVAAGVRIAVEKRIPMGAGLGGSVVALCKSEYAADTLKLIKKEYFDKYNKEFSAFETKPSMGSLVLY